jgi:hypothetical protein
MHRFLHGLITLVATLMAAGLVGCGGSKLPTPSQRLPGKWHGEMIIYDEAQAKLPAEQVAQMAQMQYDFEFRPDGSMALSGIHSGQAFTTEGRWQPVKQDGDLLVIKSTEQTGAAKDVNIEFDGKDTFYIPFNARPAPNAEVAELGAMRFTRLR